MQCKYFYCIIILISLSNIGFPENPPYPLPSEMNIQVTKQSKKHELIEFYPIGYSKNRYFAYAYYKEWFDYQNENNAMTRMYFSLIIQDMVTDKIIEKWTFQDAPQSENELGIEQVWQKKGKEISKSLNTYEIVPMDFELRSSPWCWKEKKCLSIMIKRFKPVDKLSMASEMNIPFDSYRVIAQRENGLKKTIHHNKHILLKDAEVLGIIDFSDSKRSAILVLEYGSAYADVSESIALKIIGCHLEKGFK